MVNFTNKALARMCGYYAFQREGRWAWHDAKWGKEKAEQWFDTERQAYADCVVKAGLK